MVNSYVSVSHVCSACGDQKMASDSLELELKVDMIHPVWVLGMEFKSSEKAARSLNYRVQFPNIFKNIYNIFVVI